MLSEQSLNTSVWLPPDFRCANETIERNDKKIGGKEDFQTTKFMSSYVTSFS